jgi:hypothetical protein
MAATVDALNQSSANSAANALMKAHLHLVKAVNSSKPDVNALTAALGDLGDKVSALQAALTTASTPTANGKSASKKGS